MTIRRCFFCDKILIPINLSTTTDIKNFLKEEKIDFTLSYSKSRFKIGSKDVCFECESDIQNIVNYKS
jgi:hypothetical protein